jgi:uroporphyrinogen-III synthase
MVSILSTKKLDSSLVAQAEQRGLSITLQEFIAVEPVDTPEKRSEVIQALKNKEACIAFTSAHAVETVLSFIPSPDELLHRSIACLSGKTKASLLALVPKATDIAEAPDATALANTLLKKDVHEVIFFCGNQRRDELPALLKEHDVVVREVVVYQTTEVPAKVNGVYDAVLFFSPSGVRSFFGANQLSLHTVCFAMGATTQKAIASFTQNKVIVAAAPTQEQMIAAVLEYFNKEVWT